MPQTAKTKKLLKINIRTCFNKHWKAVVLQRNFGGWHFDACQPRVPVLWNLIVLCFAYFSNFEDIFLLE